MCVESSPKSHIPSPELPEITSHPIINHQEEVIADLTWKERYLTITFKEWVNHANLANIIVDKQCEKMSRIIEDQPEINSRQQQEVWLVYETTMLNIITSQIVRRIAKTRITRTAEVARSMPELKNQIGLINRCERFLLKKLPRKLPQMAPVETAIEDYRAISYELEKMEEKILSNAKKLPKN